MIGRKESDDKATVQPRELIVDLFFINQETSDEINKKVLDVLRTCSNEGWQWYDNKDDEEWAKLTRMPIVLKQFS